MDAPDNPGYLSYGFLNAMKHSKTKILLGVSLVSILAITGAAVLFLSFREKDNVSLKQRAIRAYDDGNLKAARSLFLDVIAIDLNDENAVVKLADICGRLGDWQSASFFWQNASNLNGLEASYVSKFVNALFMARYYRRITEHYEEKKIENLSEDETLKYFYARLSQGGTKEALEAWKAFSDAHPQAVAEKPWGKLIRAAYFSLNRTFNEVLDELKPLEGNSEIPVRQEALILRAALDRSIGDEEDAEAALKTLTELNYSLGAPKLSDFYSNSGRYSEAVEVLQAFLERFYNPKIAVFQAEFMLLAGQADKLPGLLDLVNTRGGRESIQATYYIKALQAFNQMDFNSMAEAFAPVRTEAKTPLAHLVAMLADTAKDNTLLLTQDYQEMIAMPPFRDFKERANVIVSMYIGEKIRKNEPLANLARLIELLDKNTDVDNKDTELTRLSLISKMNAGILTEKDLLDAIDSSIDNRGMLEVAMGFYYFKKNYNRVLEMLDRSEKIGGEGGKLSRLAEQMCLDSLIKTEKFDQASERFRKYIMDSPEPADYVSFWVYATGFNREDDLRFMVELGKMDNTAARFAPYCEIAIQFIKGDDANALKKLIAMNPYDECLLDYAGYQCAIHNKDAEAIAFYSKIGEQSPIWVTAQLNLSRLYERQGESEKALSCAFKALEVQPGRLDAKVNYIGLLTNHGEWNKVLKSIQVGDWTIEGGEKLLDYWRWAMEASVRSNFGDGKLQEARVAAQQLQRVDPENDVASEYLRKIEETLKPAEEKDTKAADEKSQN